MATKAKKAVKAKAKAKPISLHPLINKGVFGKAKKNFAGGTLSCNCTTNPVVVEIKGQTAPTTPVVAANAGNQPALHSPSWR